MHRRDRDRHRSNEPAVLKRPTTAEQADKQRAQTRLRLAIAVSIAGVVLMIVGAILFSIGH